jgi:predicted N-acetyltransferase YhbS
VTDNQLMDHHVRPDDGSVPSPHPVAVPVTGPRYLRLATTLLQRMRLASPAGGIWEAADVQWWSRQERATDSDGQLFWLDEHGEPLAAAIRTDFGGNVQCDVLVLPGQPAFERAVWRAALRCLGPQNAAAEIPARPENGAALAELAAAGFEPAAGPGIVSSWLSAAGRPAVPELIPDFRLLSRADAPGRPHPLAARNGSQVEERLRACSLYQAELDLMVEAPNGEVAGYGLFWADLVTGVGLVEPMRTEQAWQGRGIAAHLLATGLGRLASAGCDRLKVSNDIGLYLRAGFRPARGATAAVYVRSPAAAGAAGP